VAGSSLFALIDDIASLLDDVAAMTKVATKKTAGVLGDDLALNAQQVAGVNTDRELPVVWAVAKGSAVNKAILVPAALAISALVPWLVTPLLMLGGAFLCYEGVEKLAHKFLHSKAEDDAHHEDLVKAVADPAVDMVAFEKDKIKGAIRTDFILSAEIVVIALGTVANATLETRIGVLVGIALIMTVGVYGLVAGIVKLDDAGLHLSRKSSPVQRKLGQGLLATAPVLMKTLSIAGTVAMFMVGGGILAHGLPPVHHLSESLAHGVQGVPGVGGFLGGLVSTLVDTVTGVLAGALILLVVMAVTRVFRAARPKPKPG
jgi:predicted DNA repair protein MutK